MAQSKTEEHPQFVSTNGTVVMLSLTSGHTAAVGAEPTPLHPRFHREAIIRGCVPAGFKADPEQKQDFTEKTREEVIIEAIARMVEEAHNDPAKQADLFTADGRPDATVLSARAGFQIRAGERDAAWDKYSADVEE